MITKTGFGAWGIGGAAQAFGWGLPTPSCVPAPERGPTIPQLEHAGAAH